MGTPSHLHCQSEAKELRAENAALRRALQTLVQLKDGPRDSVYQREKPKAWAAARRVLTMGPLGKPTAEMLRELFPRCVCSHLSTTHDDHGVCLRCECDEYRPIA